MKKTRNPWALLLAPMLATVVFWWLVAPASPVVAGVLMVAAWGYSLVRVYRLLRPGVALVVALAAGAIPMPVGAQEFHTEECHDDISAGAGAAIGGAIAGASGGIFGTFALASQFLFLVGTKTEKHDGRANSHCNSHKTKEVSLISGHEEDWQRYYQKEDRRRN